MSFRLHIVRPAEVALLEGLERLSRHLPASMNPKTHPQVFLAKGALGGWYLLAASDSVVRVQPVSLYWAEATLRGMHEIVGPLDHTGRLSAWLQDDGGDPLPDLSQHPARLVPLDRPGNGTATWRLEFPHRQDRDPGVELAARLLQHIRTEPPAFRPWHILVHTRAMAQFVDTFPPDLEPPVHWIPEPQASGTWAKYWAFHATTGAPLGVVLGIRSPETLKRFQERKN